MAYKKVNKSKIYRIINMNPLLLISTKSEDGKYNIAPLAWVCPQEIFPTRLLICIDSGHKTCENIFKTKKFVACIPHISQIDIVKSTGSVSGREIDKFEHFKIDSFLDKNIDCKIPNGVIGFLRCKLFKIIKIQGTAIVISDILSAEVNEYAFNGERLLTEKKEGKVIYHLGKNKFATSGDKIYIK